MNKANAQIRNICTNEMIDLAYDLGEQNRKYVDQGCHMPSVIKVMVQTTWYDDRFQGYNQELINEELWTGGFCDLMTLEEFKAHIA